MAALQAGFTLKSRIRMQVTMEGLSIDRIKQKQTDTMQARRIGLPSGATSEALYRPVRKRFAS